MKKPAKFSVEEIWDSLLSRDAQLINTTFNRLTKSEQNLVLDHLQKMTQEEGWLPAQKTSAQAALLSIEKIKKGLIE